MVQGYLGRLPPSSKTLQSVLRKPTRKHAFSPLKCLDCYNAQQHDGLKSQLQPSVSGLWKVDTTVDPTFCTLSHSLS